MLSTTGAPLLHCNRVEADDQLMKHKEVCNSQLETFGMIEQSEIEFNTENVINNCRRNEFPNYKISFSTKLQCFEGAGLSCLKRSMCNVEKSATNLSSQNLSSPNSSMMTVASVTEKIPGLKGYRFGSLRKHGNAKPRKRKLGSVLFHLFRWKYPTQIRKKDLNLKEILSIKENQKSL